MRLLIAEDEADLRRSLAAGFEKNMYCVDAVGNGREALDYALSGNYDGIILDIMMPGMNGIDVLKELRRQGFKTPVMLLTAKSAVSDRVSGLDAGADDYLPKPFALSELLARTRAMLRRKGDFVADDRSYRGLTLLSASYELRYGEVCVKLVMREYQIMEMLIDVPEHIIPTTHFMEKIWGWDANVDVSIVWVTISNLRKKLQQIGAPVSIRASRGVGYSLEAEV